ncbi:ABC transporter ATP-binding protein [Georgenia sp. AZ-5]|uniref:ABC transporter ATP-binding protein n=1 Tax=Georgenia sp. AZ-5 TaxID=3367526 RepID=UPI0037551E10
MSQPTNDERPGPAAARAVLEIRDVAVHFGGVKAVDGVSMTLSEGGIAGILGPNGSGKSTLVGAITRHVPLTRGELVFLGASYVRDHPHAVPHRGIARTFQTVRLLEDRTVRDNVLLGTDTLAGRGRAARRAAEERVEQAMERTGISGMEKVRPDELSYGVRRRVEIARAIVMEPKLLLLDEPTAGMNRAEREEIARLMHELRGEGLTQLLIEHDVQMMVDTCDHLFAMNFGKLIVEGTPQDVVRHPAVQEAYLGKRAAHHA